ncbi:MAG: glutaredoxin family protein [Nitrosomonadales bacterium]|nr:glutaredoxin family protein [Nitrosomonadales bacterium]
MRNIHLILGLAILLAGNAHAELYRSIDSGGKVYYSDRPLVGSEDVAEVKVDKAPVPEESLPYETQRAKQNFPVTLYTFPDCGSACKMARDFLGKRGVPFAEMSLVKQEEIEAFRKESGDSQIPAISIGKIWLKGFLEERWNKELDIAGYPKKAAYRQPTPVAPPAQPAQ